MKTDRPNNSKEYLMDFYCDYYHVENVPQTSFFLNSKVFATAAFVFFTLAIVSFVAINFVNNLTRQNSLEKIVSANKEIQKMQVLDDANDSFLNSIENNSTSVQLTNLGD